MPSRDDDGDIHYSEKAGTAEQQKHATRTYTYKSCRQGGKDDESSRKSESKIRIQVRNVSWSPIRASLVRELIGKIYDKDEARLRVGKEKLFDHINASHTMKWTVDQRNNIAQLYTYNVDGEGQCRKGRHGERLGEVRPEDHDHPQGIWMQYNTLLGSGYVFNTTSDPNAREDILNQARELFVHRRPHPETIEGDWTYVKETGKKSKLVERKNLDHWTNQTKVDGLPWMARAGTETKAETKTETIGSGVTLPYKFRDYDLQVLNDCTVELDLVTLDILFGDYFSVRSIDPYEKEWIYWRITEGRNRNGRTDFFLSSYYPRKEKMSYHTPSNKKVWVVNNTTTGQSYLKVLELLKTTRAVNEIVQNESHWKLVWDQEKGRLTLKEISNGKSKENDTSRSRPRSHYEGAESVYHSSNEYQTGRRPEVRSTYRRSPSVSSRGGSNQERATDDRHREYRPRSNRSLALSAHGRYIGRDQDYIYSRNHHMAPTSGSSSGVESDVVGQDISFFDPRTAENGSLSSSTRRHTQTQTEESKERRPRGQNLKKVAKFFNSDYRQERTRKRNLSREEEWKEDQRKKEKRKEEKRQDEIKKMQKREEKKWERERTREDRKRRNSGGHSDWEWSYGDRERAREPLAHRKLKVSFSYQGSGRRKRGSDV
ncbi:uncharacterized protein Bfra_006398 [Botrytis fragariae]|uniref:Uncharacterized protein n=1 Tax=Botrytis fragariae TaxID=1964551 RepID=A0A8H6B4U8_9HELO|nr:uncharacterized protein Bfra_006398 [Botrytis fragariae]KAF5879193.1 hypothetical protein Bfra_006398 [Botrytis fragariae]